jgi:hypothetical protein
MRDDGAKLADDASTAAVAHDDPAPYAVNPCAVFEGP